MELRCHCSSDPGLTQRGRVMSDPEVLQSTHGRGGGEQHCSWSPVFTARRDSPEVLLKKFEKY